MTDVWNDVDRAAYKSWVSATEVNELTLGAAFRAGLTHAREQMRPMGPSRADQWREATTEQLIALRTIVLSLAPSMPDLLLKVEESEKAWHKACVETDDYQKHRFAEREYREAEASYNAIHRALQVLEAVKE